MNITARKELSILAYDKNVVDIQKLDQNTTTTANNNRLTEKIENK